MRVISPGWWKVIKSKGFHIKEGLHGSLRDAVHQTEKILKQLTDEVSVIIDNKEADLDLLRLVVSIFVITLAFAFIYAVSRSITTSLSYLTGVFERIRETKDLSVRAEMKGKDELAEIGNVLNDMLAEFYALMQQIHESADQLNEMSNSLTLMTEQTSNRVMQQLSETDQVTTAITEMSATVHQVSQNVTEAATASQAVNDAANIGQDVVDGNSQNTNELVREIEQTSAVINQLSHESENIGSVLGVIRGIAEQTNLLALNAAIEAARAGEQGRGFAVVADEVRGLAQRSQQSTQEIKDIVDRLQQSAERAVTAMNSGLEKAETSVVHAKSVSTSLSKIIHSVNSISQMNIQIASAAEEQSAVAEEINKNTVNINDMVNETADSSRQTADMSNSLSHLAVNLKQAISLFKL